MSNFRKLKSRMGKYKEVAKKKIEEQQSYRQDDDEGFWRFTPDENGNAQATIRFLPIWDGADPDEDLPFVLLKSHAFEGKNGWYIENCPKTISYDNDCPVCEHRNTLIKKMGGWEAAKEKVRDFGIRKTYISNIYVVNDSAVPENNGKVFLWKYGPMIKGIIESAESPEFDDEEALEDPYCLWNGANFRLRVRKVKGQTNYLKSSFDEPSQLLEDEDEMEKIWLQAKDLNQFISKDKFKDYEKLKERFDKVMGKVTRPSVEDTEETEKPPKPKTKEEPIQPETSNDDDPFDSDDDDDEDYFSSLLDD